MISSKKYKVRYSGPGSKGGDYEAFEFEVVQEPGDKQDLITIRIDTRHVSHDRSDPFHLYKIAAGAVKLNLLGQIENVRYEDENVVVLGSDYKQLETVDNYREFDVTLSKPTPGFRTSSMKRL